MDLNHVIIFSDHHGQEADELVSFGLTEGSHRIHAGQGTRNRKFYFGNFYLEIVWVIDEKEIRNELTLPTGLWERSCFRNFGYSPCGLCFTHTAEMDPLFEGCVKYIPEYIPKGTKFEILTNHDVPDLPWTCRLPDIRNVVGPEEPTEHPAGLKELTKVRIGIPKPGISNNYTEFIERTSPIEFQTAENHHLILEFDHRKQGRTEKFRKLPLTIDY
ncbi:MAG: hypothetical protein KFF73_15165 [Cyclobacteriaceae bacterium]|nr:hypothetical protein [Cyclobacteriaceae bacterium]